MRLRAYHHCDAAEKESRLHNDYRTNRRGHADPALSQCAECEHHFHTLFLDGVYVDRPDGSVRLRWVKAPTSDETTQLPPNYRPPRWPLSETPGTTRDAASSYLGGRSWQRGRRISCWATRSPTASPRRSRATTVASRGYGALRRRGRAQRAHLRYVVDVSPSGPSKPAVRGSISVRRRVSLHI